MPSLPLLSELPPENLARLIALNPELARELQAPAAQERAPNQAEIREKEKLRILEERMMEAYIAANNAIHDLARRPRVPMPEPPAEDTTGWTVLRWTGATLVGIYLMIKTGVLG